mmetsp:Transcript_8421/g.12013  ORF Transcript_8421/g.12013 Transcript_8421/m.12013 type:complete len:1248 (-) Transcript_8421:56-3799(-)
MSSQVTCVKSVDRSLKNTTTSSDKQNLSSDNVKSTGSLNISRISESSSFITSPASSRISISPPSATHRSRDLSPLGSVCNCPVLVSPDLPLDRLEDLQEDEISSSPQSLKIKDNSSSSLNKACDVNESQDSSINDDNIEEPPLITRMMNVGNTSMDKHVAVWKQDNGAENLIVPLINNNLIFSKKNYDREIFSSLQPDIILRFNDAFGCSISAENEESGCTTPRRQNTKSKPVALNGIWGNRKLYITLRSKYILSLLLSGERHMRTGEYVDAILAYRSAAETIMHLIQNRWSRILDHSLDVEDDEDEQMFSRRELFMLKLNHIVSLEMEGKDFGILSVCSEETQNILYSLALTFIHLGNAYFYLSAWDLALCEYDCAKSCLSGCKQILKERENKIIGKSKRNGKMTNHLAPILVESISPQVATSIQPINEERHIHSEVDSSSAMNSYFTNNNKNGSDSCDIGINQDKFDEILKISNNHSYYQSAWMKEYDLVAQIDVMVMNNIALIYAKLGQYKSSKRLFAMCLSFKRKKLRAVIDKRRLVNRKDLKLSSDDVSDTVQNIAVLSLTQTLHNIGVLRTLMKNWKKSKDACMNALSLRVESCGLDDHRVASTMRNLGDVYFMEGNFNEALSSYYEILRIYLKEFGNRSLQVAVVLHNIGLVYHRRGPFSKAKEVLSKALHLRIGLLGLTHIDVSATLYVLGLVLTATGDFDDALISLKCALKIRVKHLGKFHLSSLNCSEALGHLYRKKGDYLNAILHFKLVQNARKVRLGERHHSTLLAFEGIGLAYRDQGDYSTASDIFELVLKDKLELLGTDTAEVAETLCNLGTCQSELGLDAAINKCKQSLEIFLTRKGESHLSISYVQRVLGDLKQISGDLDCALKCYNESIKIIKLWHGPEHLDNGDLLNSMGNIYFKKNDFKSAIECYKESYRIKNIWLDQRSDSLWMTATNLGHSYHKTRALIYAQDAYTASIKNQMMKFCDGMELVGSISISFRRICDTIRNVVENDEIMDQISFDLGNLASSFGHIGLLHKDKGDLERSLEYYELAILARETQPAFNNDDIAILAEIIGTLNFKLKRYNVAIETFNQCLRIRGDNVSSSLEVSRVLNKLANVNFAKGDFYQALDLYSRSLNIKVSELERDDIEIINTQSNIAHVMLKLGRDEESLTKYQHVLALKQQKFGDKHISLAKTLTSIGHHYLNKGDYHNAKENFHKSVVIRRNHLGTSHPEYLNNLETLGLVYRMLLDSEKG